MITKKNNYLFASPLVKVIGKCTAFCFAFFCSVLTLSSQPPGHIPAESPITLVYKITDSEAGKLYRKQQKSVNEKMLRQCTDTLKGITETLPDNYPNGHYLLVNASGSSLNFRLLSITPFEHRMLNNQRDMSLVVFDRVTGEPVTDAKVKVGNNKLRFDKKTQSYRRAKTDKQGILSIEADSITAYYTISRKYNLNTWKRAKNGVWNVPVLKYVTRPVIFVTSIPLDTYRSIKYGYPVGSIRGIQKPFADIYRSISWGYPIGWIENIEEFFDNRFYDEGFMVFSKPKYMPGDTVRFKAYVTNNMGKPVKDSLNVFIQTDKKHKIETIMPYRRGFYTMEFVPKPDYGMKLDRYYTITLEKKRKFIQNGRFYYEDYELKNVEYNIRTAKEEYFSHEEVTFYAKATDENNMPIPDARLELRLETDFISDFSDVMVKVPDVLWRKELSLDPVGETVIIVPDSVFPNASVRVKMIANFNNSDNQTGYKDLRFKRLNSNERIVVNQSADSLLIHYEKLGIPVSGLQANIRRGLLEDTVVVLPAGIKIHPLVETYHFSLLPQPNIPETEKYKRLPTAYFSPSADNSGVACSMSRNDGYIFITVENPLNLPLIYTVYRGNKERVRGSENLSIYKSKAKKRDYFLSVQYIWGGKEHSLEYRSAHNAAQLKLTGSLPPVVFPGQTVTVNIVATDQNGNPVPNVDLTVYGFTSKFGEQPMPNIPSYQKPPSNRKPYNAFTSKDLTDSGRKKELDYPQWQTPLKLDSAVLYRFAYPEKEIFRHAFPSADHQTYIAPYLVHNGKLLPIQILYINDRPVYFARTTTDIPYMFPVTGGNHKIRIRTNNFEVTALINAKTGCKNIFSIDPYKWDIKTMMFDNFKSWGINDNKRIDFVKYQYRVNKKENEYSFDEINLMRNYLMTIHYQPKNTFAWLQHGNNIELLTSDKSFNKRHYNTNNTFITGPVSGTTPITLWEENNHIYTFERNGIKWSEYEPFAPVRQPLISRLNIDYKMPRMDWNALPYTKQYIDNEISKRNFEYIKKNIRYTNPFKFSTSGQLLIETTLSDSLMDKSWCWILYNHTNDESHFYTLIERKFTFQQNGTYSLFLLMNDKTFYTYNSIDLETGVTTLLRLPIEEMKYYPCPIDICRKELRSLMLNLYVYGGMDINVPPKPRPVETPVVYNPAYAGIDICGKITDEEGDPIIGACVFVKGNPVVGTITDINGNYCIRIPQGYRTLVFSFIGMKSHEITPLTDANVNVVMESDARQLDEVVVTGMMRMDKRLFTGATDRIDFRATSLDGVADISRTLEGRSAGVSISNVNGTFGSASTIRVRGVTSLDTGAQPLYVVNGVVMTDISHISQENITGINVLKGDAATSLYGARAANGVIIITTGGGIAAMDAQDIMKQILEDEAYQTGLASAKGLRTNFSDEALWQPALTTDRSGKATFKTTFPDDVTKWNIRMIGMLPGKASESVQTQVRSFKPLMGQLSVPRFIVEGDTANVIGKITNYSQDTVRLNIDFAINGAEKWSKYETIRHSLIDTLTVVAPEILPARNNDGIIDIFNIPAYILDSIAVRYQLMRDDGYRDGEERHIPVVRRGTTENVGQFLILDTDTTVTVSLIDNKAPVTLSLESSSLDILMKETQRLRDYRHLCNEQTASRLKALLLERKAFQLYGKEYPHDKIINSLINRLIKGRNDDGLWGWFGNSDREIWISIHAVEALLQASDDGFKVNTDFERITNRLIIYFDYANDVDRIRILELLVRINPTSNYRAMFDKIVTDMQNTDIQKRGAVSLHSTDSLRLMELSLHFGEKPEIEKVLQNKKTDKFGNVHWSEVNQRHWRYNDITLTLAAYCLLRSAGGHDKTLLKIRNYLLSQRNLDGWRNTYETANILATIMPDILASGDSIGNSRLRISRDGTLGVITVDTFPKNIVLLGNEPVIIDKKGSFPVYVTAWQETFVRNPEPVNEGFRVETRFIRSPVETRRNSTLLTDRATSLRNNTLITLSAGKPVTLEVTVSSIVSSEYVIIEIPIPAGCSYQSKPQTYYRGMGETHREYFRDRVCIYIRNLNKGEHTFRVELMPRYTGVYHVNPAKAERMYTPLYFGRTGVKEVRIED